MSPGEQQRQLEGLLRHYRDCWHPQPFRELRPDWCHAYPALTADLLALDQSGLEALSADNDAALAWLTPYLPELGELRSLIRLAQAPAAPVSAAGERWAWEIPGRKRAQIEAFAASARCCGQPVVDWCGGKGHLGRLLAGQWGQTVHTLEIDAVLCAAGERLASRQAAGQHFVVADALATTAWPQPGQHAVALHACGDLHRRLLQRGVVQGVRRFDVAPCCYHRGVGDFYQPLSSGSGLALTRDDVRLAVTETVTASPRLARRRDREMAWKLGFDAYRHALSAAAYQNFKPVPSVWFAGDFSGFLQRMAVREGLAVPVDADCAQWELAGWQRHREVMRLSLPRQAFRRALEIWLVLDLAVYLEQQGYAVNLQSFCDQRLTPRNLLISAERAD